MTIIISKKRKRMAGPRGFGPLTCGFLHFRRTGAKVPKTAAISWLRYGPSKRVDNEAPYINEIVIMNLACLPNSIYAPSPATNILQP